MQSVTVACLMIVIDELFAVLAEFFTFGVVSQRLLGATPIRCAAVLGKLTH